MHIERQRVWTGLEFVAACRGVPHSHPCLGTASCTASAKKSCTLLQACSVLRPNDHEIIGFCDGFGCESDWRSAKGLLITVTLIDKFPRSAHGEVIACTFASTAFQRRL